jgi:phosphate-selective porin OprO and OprP
MQIKRMLAVDAGTIRKPFLLLIVLLFPIQNALAERIFFAGYKGGFYIRSEEEGGMELRLGGAFQTDYRYYAEEERADNRFDISRARLIFAGQLSRYLRYGLEYEFQGNETDNLIEAWAEAVFGPSSLRFGQFKEPFSLEWQSVDKAQYFAERSMGYYLGPRRDIGIMLHGSWFQDAMTVAAGVFNGDGDDGSASGPEADTPEAAARITFAPFKGSAFTWLNGIQLGASATYAEIDPINIDLRVKSTGMAGTDRNLYVLTHNTKFGVIQDTGSRHRIGVEAAWAIGPVIFQGEYITLTYADLQAAGDNRSDADFSSWYASAIWCITGETPILSKGILKPIYPNHFFNPREGTWGAFYLAARVEHFSGDEDWINPDAHVSVKDADAYSLALNWVLFPMARTILDYTHTSLSDPIRVRVLPDGSADYIDAENVVTCRFSIDF